MKKDTKFKKGQVPWNKGKPHPQTPEQNRKRIAALPRGINHHMFGKKHSPESLAKISISRRGKNTGPFSDEHKRNMSLGAKGRKMPPRTEAHKLHLSQSHKGRVVSEETRRKIGRANWKNGLTPLYALIRHCFEYRQWVSDIFTRDSFTCTICGVRGGTLNADHIKKFSKIIKSNNIKSFQEALICAELWDINNGRTLCVPCHRRTDTYGKKEKVL